MEARTPAASLRVRFYPMGFPLDLVTDSESVLAAASRIWSPYSPAFAGQASSVQIEVRKAHSRTAFHPPSYDLGPRLLHVARPPNNFGICSLTTGAAFARMTSDVTKAHVLFAYYFLEPLAYIGLEVLHVTALHSACVALDGRALLLYGDSGAGKTSLAYACARRGWTYLSGDATHIVRASPHFLVVGRPHEIRFREHAQHQFPELRSFVGAPRPNGKRDIEADPRELGLATTAAARAAHVVFLNRTDPCVRSQLRPYPREKAAQRWRQYSQWGDAALRLTRSQSIERFLDLPLHELTYADAGDAEPLLRSLIETGSGSCAGASNG